jgi:mono/diheme cytochrome c family protein
MHKRLLRLGALALAALGGMAFSFGGWAVVTVDDLPQSLTVGQPTTLAFAIRQHGVTLLNGLTPTLVAVDEKGEAAGVNAPATRDGEGHYVAKLTVPRPGHWSVTINTSFMNNRTKLSPIPAVVAGQRVKDVAVADVGQSLYVAKGCVGCHVHGAVTGYPAMNVGPNLTPKRYQAEYLAKLLVDPSIARTPGQQNKMPALGLKPAEISALVAFINADRQVSSK